MALEEHEIKKIVEEYQCPGCMHGSDFSCYEKGDNIECASHFPGTMMSFVGTFFLGMPKGFNRLGMCKDMRIKIFDNTPDVNENYDVFNVPVWKYLDAHQNTIVRGISPRINAPFLHILIGNHIKYVDCIEINDALIENID